MSEAAMLASVANLRGASRVRKERKQFSHDEFQEMLAVAVMPVMPAIISKAAEQAQEGDDKARTWLSDRIWGRASQNVNIQGSIEHHYEGQVNVAVLAAQAALQLKQGKT